MNFFVSMMCRLVAAGLVSSLVVAGTAPPAKAQALERYTLESLWLSQASSVLSEFLGMVEPVYEVTRAVTADYNDAENYELGVTAAVESARSRLRIIHENVQWQIENLPEQPKTTNNTAKDLMRKVGDLKAQAEDVQLISETAISNLEASLKGDPSSELAAIREIVSLFANFAVLSDITYEISLAESKNDHPANRHMLIADQATIHALFELRQLEFLSVHLENETEFQRVMAAMIASMKVAATESRKVTKYANEFIAYAESPQAGYVSSFEIKAAQDSLDTEKMRTEVLSALERVVYQMSRKDALPADVIESVDEVLYLFPYMIPSHRQYYGAPDWQKEKQSRPGYEPGRKANL